MTFLFWRKKYGRVLEYQNQIKTESICSDKDMLSKILENIFDNALRFSEKVIYFSITEKNNCICFTVYDDGKGFSKDELKYATTFFIVLRQIRATLVLGCPSAKSFAKDSIVSYHWKT